ncbi:hypothetical protein Tco_1341149, partial [Tanacetum coccineum]
EDIILKLKKKQREKVVPYTLFLSLLIMHKMKEDYGIDEPTVFKAPKTSSRAESVSQGAKPEAKLDTRSLQLLQNNPLWVTSEERANPQLSNGMSALNLNKPIFSASFIIHSESASGHDVLADFTVEADPGLSTPNDYIPPQQDQTKSVSEGLEIILTQPTTKREQAPLLYMVIKKRPLLLYMSQKHKLELEKNKAEAKAALLKSQPSFPNVEQFNKLLTLQWELPEEFISLTAKVESAQAKLKTLDALPSLLLSVTKALNKFAEVLESTSTKARDQSVPSAGQADTMPAEGEKDTNQATISQLFQRRAEKIDEAEKENLNQQPKPTTPPTTTPINPPIITTTTQMQIPLQSPPRSSSQPEGEHIKKDKGKKVMSSEEAEKESTESDSNEEAYVAGSMELEEEAKAKAAKEEGEVRKAELIDLLGPEVVHKYYNYKLQYDRYYDKMLNRKAESRITNCDVLTRKGPITFKVYREDGTYKVISNFKVSDLHLGEWRKVMKACPYRKGKGWQTIYDQILTRMEYLHITEAELGINLDIPLSMHDPLDKLNDLANKKRKHA